MYEAKELMSNEGDICKQLSYFSVIDGTIEGCLAAVLTSTH